MKRLKDVGWWQSGLPCLLTVKHVNEIKQYTKSIDTRGKRGTNRERKLNLI